MFGKMAAFGVRQDRTGMTAYTVITPNLKKFDAINGPISAESQIVNKQAKHRYQGYGQQIGCQKHSLGGLE